MQRALYDLEDRIAYRAAAAKKPRRQRRLWALSLWAGLAGDLVGELAWWRDGSRLPSKTSR